MSTTLLHRIPDVIDVRDWPAPPAGWTTDEVGILRAGIAARTIPEHVLAALLELNTVAPQAGALLLRGLPLGDVPATPPTPTTPLTMSAHSHWNLMVVARLLGQPVGYAPEHGGDLIQNIVPTQTGADRQLSTSSKVTLMFHTEAAFHPHRPRFLLLLCLRGDASARTTLSSVHEILAHLSPDVRRVLGEPRFRTAVDESYLHGRANVLGEPTAVLQGDPARPTLLFDADLMVGMDPEADDALLAMSDLIAQCQTGVALQAGDLLVVDNFAAVHGRSPYQPRFDGTDRWLQRTFVVSDLAPSAGHRRGRVITTEFGA